MIAVATNFLGNQATRPGQGRCDAPGGCQHTQGFGLAWASCERRSFDHRATVVRAADEGENTVTHARARIRHARASVLERGGSERRWACEDRLAGVALATDARRPTRCQTPRRLVLVACEASQRMLGDRRVARAGASRRRLSRGARNGCSETKSVASSRSSGCLVEKQRSRNGHSETEALPAYERVFARTTTGASQRKLGGRGVARSDLPRSRRPNRPLAAGARETGALPEEARSGQGLPIEARSGRSETDALSDGEHHRTGLAHQRLATDARRPKRCQVW